MPSIPARVRSISLPPFDVLNTKAANLRAAGHDVITLGQGVPGFGPPAPAIDAARRALASPATHLYCADAGLSSLRSVLCDRLREHHGIDATAGRRDRDRRRQPGLHAGGNHAARSGRRGHPVDALLREPRDGTSGDRRGSGRSLRLRSAGFSHAVDGHRAAHHLPNPRGGSLHAEQSHRRGHRRGRPHEDRARAPRSRDRRPVRRDLYALRLRRGSDGSGAIG